MRSRVAGSVTVGGRPWATRSARTRSRIGHVPSASRGPRQRGHSVMPRRAYARGRLGAASGPQSQVSGMFAGAMAFPLLHELLMAGPGRGDLERLLPPEPPWMADGACREHPEVEFVFDENQRSSGRRRLAAAVAVCSGCLVRDECRAYAADDPSLVGVWGGTSSAERRLARASHVA